LIGFRTVLKYANTPRITITDPGTRERARCLTWYDRGTSKSMRPWSRIGQAVSTAATVSNATKTCSRSSNSSSNSSPYVFSFSF